MSDIVQSGRPPRVRCAIYTRKSSEEGLEQEFNSLDAQREAGESYVLSQKHEGWMLVPEHYDDGGYSGGNLDRPALNRLLEDIRAGHIDVVVVYKVDRLSRSLTDFARIVQVFEESKVSFVSVTQHFNTSSSMGRLTLNILLSFAQFEREVIGERIRDKFAASRKKGMWMGGQPPLGYDIVERRLVVNAAEAQLVQHLFTRFTQIRSATLLVKECERDGLRTKAYVSGSGRHQGGRLIDKCFLYRLLRMRLYLGEVVHKGKVYPGQHQPVIPQHLWDEVQGILRENPVARGNKTRRENPALLRGLVRCGCCDCAMTPITTGAKRGRKYTYYTPMTAIKRHYTACRVGPMPAGELEDLVVRHVRQLVKTPEAVAGVWRQAKGELDGQDSFGEREVFEALGRFDTVWDNLFYEERQRLMNLLVAGVTVNTSGLQVRLRVDGMRSVVEQIKASQTPAQVEVQVESQGEAAPCTLH
ncbi:MAG TPA: recombinase family protein [Alphaproteobacteria bacterium]|nr:recombinase family protein [Alphaproteobacteria bacterium]